MNDHQQQLIATLLDGTQLLFDQGRFDKWCIYHLSSNQRYAVKDIDVFQILEKYNASPLRFKLYQDFVYIFDNVEGDVCYFLVEQIKRLAKAYPNAAEIEFVLMFLYAGMVAEENKKFAKLKKYIKRLGVHQVLVEKQAANIAANYSRGKKWFELQQECEARGFYLCSSERQNKVPRRLYA